jgi:hypothetical protein
MICTDNHYVEGTYWKNSLWKRSLWQLRSRQLDVQSNECCDASLINNLFLTVSGEHCGSLSLASWVCSSATELTRVFGISHSDLQNCLVPFLVHLHDNDRVTEKSRFVARIISTAVQYLNETLDYGHETKWIVNLVEWKRRCCWLVLNLLNG